jgi:hypothetical protein
LAVVVTVAKGYDLGDIWKTQGEAAGRTTGGHYINAAQAGEPPGRWWGRGVQALGLTPGQIVQRKPYDAVYQQIDPCTGARLGRPPGPVPDLRRSSSPADGCRAARHDRAAHRAGTPSSAGDPPAAAYTDVTISFSKSISVLHASIRENQRRARMAGDQQAAAYWAARDQRFQEILHQANRATLEYLQAWAGVTRTGYHGTPIDGREPGRFEPAGLIVTSWLQGTSRDGDPQDHIHNQIARITRTFRDGKWRALDTMTLSGVLGALQAIAATAVECELTREFGVAWVPRADGRGNEIRGVTQAQMDAYSTRTVQVHEKEHELARVWEAKHGRAPTPRELLHDLLKQLALVMPPETRQMSPQAAQQLLLGLAEEALSGRTGEVVCLEAPQWPSLPASLHRQRRGPGHREHDSAPRRPPTRPDPARLADPGR